MNDLYFRNSKDIDNLDVEFDNEEFNQFDENGVIEGLISMSLINEKSLIAMPAIHVPAENDEDTETFISLEYYHFFNINAICD